MGDGGKIEPQDLIPDRTLKRIFINCIATRPITRYDIDNRIHDKNSDSSCRGTKKKKNEEKHENIQQIEGKMH